ncbi:MAG: hypothetical protein IJM37_01280 [Lachnospiraceae bacterium]|nr:hypothetical protein [Lachnospiraceae bacterium]
MKKILILVLVCTVLLSGCGKSSATKCIDKEIKPLEGFKNTEYNLETDSQNYFSQYADIFAVENGYYMLSTDLLFYTDKDKIDFQPVCSNPACNHANPECDAYIEFASSIKYYEGDIYYVASVLKGFMSYEDTDHVYELHRRSLDGSVDEKICDLGYGRLVLDMTIHRGYAYFRTFDGSESAILNRVKLDKTAEKEELFRNNKGELPEIYGVKGYGDGVLFCADYPSEDNPEVLKVNIYYYDSNEDAVKLVKEDADSQYAVADGELYYYKTGGVYRYDMSSKQESLFYPSDEMVSVSYDGKYFYFNNQYEHYFLEGSEEIEDTIYVVDKEGNKIDAIEVPGYGCYDGDSDWLFQEKGDGYQFLDKKQIGTGKFEWIYLDRPSVW